MCGDRFVRSKRANFLIASWLLQACVSPSGVLNFSMTSANQAGNSIFWNGFTQLVVGQCAGYLLNIGTIQTPAVVTLSDVGTGIFYQDSSCTNAITSIVIPANTSSQMVFFKTTQADNETLQASAAGLGNATYSVNVASGTLAPSIATPASQTLPSHAAVVGNAIVPYTFLNANTGNNSGMTYTCLLNKDFSNAFSTSCGSLSGLSFIAASGALSWTPTSTETGAYYFQVKGTNSAGSAAVNFTIDVLAGYSTANIVFDYNAQFANLISPNINSPMATTWRNINTSGSTYDGLLSGFPTVGVSGSDGWSGDGTVGNPFSLFFNGSQVVNVASNIASSPEMFTAWISPNNIVSTHTGGVIVSSNNNGQGLGVTIRQSAQFSGTLELETVGSYTYTQDIMTNGSAHLLGYWRLNSSGSLIDSSGNSNGGAFYLGSTATSATLSTATPITNDSTSESISVPYNSTGPVLGNGSTSIPSNTPPQTFSEEIWFNAPSGYAQGGLLMGFGNHSINQSTLADRLIYMDASGKINAGIYNTTTATISSTSSYNDGFWHQAAVTFTGNGTTGSFLLYVDGILVSSASGPSVSLANSVNGVWRFGYDTLQGWPSRPPSDEFLGQLSEASAYNIILAAADVKRHFNLGTRRCQSSVISSNNNWVFVASTYDGTTSTLYVNGNSACSTNYGTSGTLSTGSTAITIGNHGWTGALADLKALASGDSTTVTNIYGATSPRF